MKIRDLIINSRSFRRFHQNFAVDIETLKELVELARLSPSAANRQPIKYMLSCDPERNALVFPHLAFGLKLAQNPLLPGTRGSNVILWGSGVNWPVSNVISNVIGVTSNVIGVTSRDLAGEAVAVSSVVCDDVAPGASDVRLLQQNRFDFLAETASTDSPSSPPISFSLIPSI